MSWMSPTRFCPCRLAVQACACPSAVVCIMARREEGKTVRKGVERVREILFAKVVCRALWLLSAPSRVVHDLWVEQVRWWVQGWVSQESSSLVCLHCCKATWRLNWIVKWLTLHHECLWLGVWIELNWIVNWLTYIVNIYSVNIYGMYWMDWGMDWIGVWIRLEYGLGYGMGYGMDWLFHYFFGSHTLSSSPTSHLIIIDCHAGHIHLP